MGINTPNSHDENIEALEAYSDILPSEHTDYFKAMEAKHFNPETAIGSYFTSADTKSLPDLLAKAEMQRGGLKDDDKEKFSEKGVPNDAMLPFCRYLMVNTEGKMGMVKATDLPDDTKVKVVRTKPNAPCSFVVEVDSTEQLTDVDYATIIIGPNEKNEENPNPSTKEMIWTIHPGPPIRPATSDIIEEGTVVTAKELLSNEQLLENVKGADNLYLNLQVKNQ